MTDSETASAACQENSQQHWTGQKITKNNRWDHWPSPRHSQVKASIIQRQTYFQSLKKGQILVFYCLDTSRTIFVLHQSKADIYWQESTCFTLMRLNPSTQLYKLYMLLNKISCSDVLDLAQCRPCKGSERAPKCSDKVSQRLLSRLPREHM